MHGPVTNHDARTMALLALAWCLGDARRADRLLNLTGLTAHDLRERINDQAVCAAVLSFLEAHEPDLIACAAELGVEPAALVAARQELER